MSTWMITSFMRESIEGPREMDMGSSMIPRRRRLSMKGISGMINMMGGGGHRFTLDSFEMDTMTVMEFSRQIRTITRDSSIKDCHTDKELLLKGTKWKCFIQLRISLIF